MGKKGMLLAIGLAMLCLVPMAGMAQVFGKSHFSFHWLSMVTPAHQTNNTVGNIKLRTRPTRGFQFGTGFTHYFKMSYGIKTGLFFTTRSYHLAYDLDASQYGLPYDAEDKIRGNLFYHVSIPLAFSYRKLVGLRSFMGIEAGGYLKLYIPGSVSSGSSMQDSLGNDYRIIYFDTDLAGSKVMPVFDFYVMPYWQFALRNHRMLQVGFHVNLALWKHPLEGSYQVLPQSPYATIGDYNYRSTNFGLDVAYVLPLKVPNPKRVKRRNHPDEIFKKIN